MNKGVNRRDFFKLAAVSGAAVAVAGCEADPVEEIIPMLVPPHDYVPGVSIHFATTCNECSAQCGMVVRTREGRAIKAEGNRKNPINNGGLCAIGQGSMQGLYAPTRLKGPKGKGGAVTWADGKKLLTEQLAAAGGSVVYIGNPASGSIEGLKDEFLKATGGGKAFQYDANPTASVKEGNRIAFGKNEIPHYAIESAKVLVSFGADFLESWLSPVTFTKGYSKMHAFQGGEKGKFIHVSSHMSLTGTNADQWIDTAPGTEAQIALAVAAELLGSASVSGADKSRLNDYLSGYDAASVSARTGVPVEKIKALAAEFNQGGASLAIAGGTAATGRDATALQVAVNILNHVAGNIGKTVQFGANYQTGGDSLNDILAALKAGPKVVIIENANPIYSLPEDSGFKAALASVPFVVSLSTEVDETSAMAHLHLPTSHYLESWGDANPRTGVNSLMQPVMAKVPGYDTMTLGDLLVEMSGNAAGDFRNFIKSAWASKVDGEAGWRKALQTGGIFGDFSITGAALAASATSVKPSMRENKGLTLIPSNSPLHNVNGASGNRTWFLEVAHPVTQLVWDSWAEINPDTALELGLSHGDLIEVTTSKGTHQVGVWFYYGINKGAIAMPTGRGRSVPFPTYVSTREKSILLPHVEMASDVKITGHKVGENVMDLIEFGQDQSGDLAYNDTAVTIKSTGKKAWLVTPEGMAKDDIEALTADTKGGMGDRSQKDRGFVQMVDAAVLRGEKEDHSHYGHKLRERQYTTDNPDNSSFYKERSADVADHNEWRGRGEKPVYYDPYKWEMTIDLDRCTGCSACVVACYAENNISVVGKERMGTGREMNWIRIERYIEKNKETGELETYFTPEMCQQCENAGCEPVCPVYATYHNLEGINAMVYNRCVGTRYCLNNCVYKQRRFNWRTYEFPAPLHLQLNPAVTVRTKGVMEKCNFCISRIREMKDIAKDQGREVHDGEILTACQETCPADALTFGNASDENSRLSRINSTSKRTYKQLEEVAFKPSLTYLKKVTHNNSKA